MESLANNLHTPWTRDTLKELLQKIILTTETNKIDFKRDFSLSDSKQKGEFLKDVSAIANSYDVNYQNHGFIIFGIYQNRITFCSFPGNEDHIQATIDELIREYLGSFFSTQFYIFDKEGKKWGVLVIPPTRNAPHVFIKDTSNQSRGDIYVRVGTTTSKASPVDFSRFFRQYIEEYDNGLQYKIGNLQNQISILSKKLEKRIKTDFVSKKGKELTTETTEIEQNSKSGDNKPISEVIDGILAKEESIIAKGLLQEAKKINEFLMTNEIPWDAFLKDRNFSEPLISKIEEISNEYWVSVIKLLAKDDKGLYDDCLVKSVKYLSVTWDLIPGIGSYTEAGKNIRYFPLVVTLYLIFILGVANKKDKLLKRILSIKLRTRSHYEEPLPIVYALFLIRSATNFFDPFYEQFPRGRWCDAVATYTKLLIDRILVFDDMFWDNDAEFFKGEFVLCLSPLNITELISKITIVERPSSGLYLFMPVANPVISRFLKEENDWLSKVFERPLKEILIGFDKIVGKIAYRDGCFGEGFAGGASRIVYPELPKSTE
jgi:hypothetical protein